MSAIGPGDWVECVQPFDKIAVGDVLVVDDVNNWPCRCGRNGGLSFGGRTNADGLPGHCIFRFRPIYRPKSEIIQSLLQPVRVDA